MKKYRKSRKITEREVVVTTLLASKEAGLTNRLCGSVRILGIVSGQAFTICGIAQAIIRRQYMMLLSTESKIK